LCTLVVICLSVATPALAAAQPPTPEQAHRVAYQRWSDTIDAHPTLGVPFWVQTENGPADLREAVAALVSYGPNLVPFLVQELRAETDQARMYRLILLLNRVSGINLYYNSGEENVYAAVATLKARFLRDWDAGNYTNATALLRKSWKEPDPEDKTPRIDPKSITLLRRYGVYAVPFIAETLQGRNSPEMFAAFLIIADQPALYTAYIEDPSASFSTGAQKMAQVKDWARKNERKMDRLKGLHERIRTLAIQ
jgi:hypothetical protein